MDAGTVPNQRSIFIPAVPARSTVVRFCYRAGLIVVGLAWVCLASALCGCSQMNGWVMNQSGQAYYARGNYTAARYEFERAMMDDPYNPTYAYNAAKAMEHQGEMAGAERMYQQALTLDPRHQPAYHGLSEMLVSQGRQEDARQLLAAWSDTQPYNPATHVEMAGLYRRMGDYSTAEQELQTALRMNPRSPQALEQMGMLQQQVGRPDMAAAFYQRSLGSNPFQPEVSSRLDGLAQARYPSSGVQLANWMTRSDPTIGGSPAVAGYASPQFSSGPAMAGTSAMYAAQGMATWNGPMPGNQIVGHPGAQAVPTYMSPQVMAPGSGGQVITGQPYVVNSPVMGQNNPPMMLNAPPHAQPIPADSSMYSPPAMAAPIPGQPVELGSPVPLTQVHPGLSVSGQSVGGAPPVVQAF